MAALCIVVYVSLSLLCRAASEPLNVFVFTSYLASRKAEKEEEKRAREKVRQKLEADKVSVATSKKYFCYSMCMRQGYA